MPQAAPQEAPAEELARLGRELTEPAALDGHGDHVGAFAFDGDDAQPVPQSLADRDEPSVPGEQDADAGVQQSPEPGGKGGDADVGAGELMDEAEGGGEVGEQVDAAPRLVRDPAAYGPGGDQAHTDQQGGSGVGGGDGRVAEQVPIGAEQVGPAAQGVHDEGEEPVGGAQNQHPPAAEGVPAGETVGADAVLDRRDASGRA